MNSRFRAFTLAEVLITLGIIGVVAALTIPALIANFQKKQISTQAQKAYAEIVQALKASEAENGFTDQWYWQAGSNLALTRHFADDYFYPYLKIAKKCDSGETGCWANVVSLDGTASNIDPSKVSGELSVIMASGYSVLFWTGSSPNTVQIWIDTDGPNKGKNKFGQDVFGFMLGIDNTALRQGLYPMGAHYVPPKTRDELKTNTTNGCEADITGAYAGAYCAGLLMYDNWVVSDDYPWK